VRNHPKKRRRESAPAQSTWQHQQRNHGNKRIHANAPVHAPADLQLGARDGRALGRVLVDAKIDHSSRRGPDQGPAVEVVWVHGSVYHQQDQRLYAADEARMKNLLSLL
jgi:hypothetical protein